MGGASKIRREGHLYFEGIDSERGIAWRAADSFGLRQFLRIGLDEQTPDHSTISRTRRLLDVETHRKVFFWVLERLRDQGGVKGKTVGMPLSTTVRETKIRRSTFPPPHHPLSRRDAVYFRSGVYTCGRTGH